LFGSGPDLPIKDATIRRLLRSIFPEKRRARVPWVLRLLESDELARYDSPAFGPMSHQERVALNLRHAELHLSFLQR